MVIYLLNSTEKAESLLL